MPLSRLSWADLPIRFKCTAVVFLPISALVIASGFGFWSLLTERQAEQFVAATATARATLSTLHDELEAAESGLASYSTLGRAADQLRAQQSLADAQRTVTDLRAINTGDRIQQTRILDLSSGIPELLSLSFAEKSERGPAAIKKMLALILRIEGEESRLLAQRASDLRRSQFTSEIVILAALMIGLITAILAAKLLSRSITRRVSDLLEGVGVVGHGMTVIPVDNSQDELGKLAFGLAHTSRLLSERQAEISEVSSRLQSVLRAASEVSILAEDKDGRITVFNAGAEKLLGYRVTEVMGRELALLFHPGASIGSSQALPEDIQSAREFALRDNPHEQEVVYVRKDGLSLDVQLSVTPLKNVAGRIVGLLHVAQDVSPRKVLERELRKKNEEMKAQAEKASESTGVKEALLNRLQAEVAEPLKELERRLGSLKQTTLDSNQFELASSSRALAERISDVVAQALQSAGSSSTSFAQTALEANCALPELIAAVGAQGGSLIQENGRTEGKQKAFDEWYEDKGELPGPSRPAQNETPRILIVDDFEDTRFLLRVHLQELGCNLDFAGDGEEALRKVAEERYNLILMDIEMPKMDGYQTTLRIRNWEKRQGRPPIPIVALTAHETSGESAFRNAEWTSYLCKPLTKTQLLKEVRAHITANAMAR